MENSNQRNILRDMFVIIFAGLVGLGILWMAKIIFDKEDIKPTSSSIQILNDPNDDTDKLKEKIDEQEKAIYEFKRLSDSKDDHDIEKQKLIEQINLLKNDIESIKKQSEIKVSTQDTNQNLSDKVNEIEKNVQLFLDNPSDWKKGLEILLNISEFYKQKLPKDQNLIIEVNIKKMIDSGLSFVTQNSGKQEFLDLNKKIIDAIEKVMNTHKKAFNSQDRKRLEATKFIALPK